ncbi:zinc finger BED domain-containing protein RICESLEEPER 2-like [Silene latifolia]|uniref:zinc finger BED domain-containing protein RICESLEEPER 2-like n=1 Tax=Silene latifolia TaxID=37657 RepID=UPI003D789603
MVGDVRKARCKACKKDISYKEGSGVSHLRKHILKSCPMRFLGNIHGQKKLRTILQDDGTTTLELKEKYKEFDQDFNRSKLVTMVVIHEYPLSMVDHFGFREYSKSLNPSFKLISRNTLRVDIFKMYNADKLSFKRLLEYNDSRIAVTTDIWTASNQKKGYMVVTSHFIDRNWNLRNRTLRFCFVPCPHTQGVIAKVLMDCLSQYGLESKISAVVVDNCTTNDAMMKIILKNFEKKCLILSGAFLHLRCSAHILNLIVKDGLEFIESGIAKVRGCVSFWMSTPKRIEKFEESCRFQGINNSKRLILDCKTRWNSTFAMLESALPYEDVFVRLKRLNEKLKFDIPSHEDWMLASIICNKLSIFSNATKVFSGRLNPTSNLFFRKACEIKLALRDWLKDDVGIVKSMAKKMIEKFDKYWEHINGLLAIAAILDPRDKMDCVRYYFNKLYAEKSEEELDKVRKLLDDLVLEYQRRSEGSKTKEVSKGKRKIMNEVTDVEGEDEFSKEKKRQ